MYSVFITTIIVVAALIRLMFIFIRYVQFSFATSEYLENAYRNMDKAQWRQLVKKCSQIRFEWHKIVYLHEWGNFDRFVDFTQHSILFWQIMDNWNSTNEKEL